MTSNASEINKIGFIEILNKLGYFEGNGFKLHGNQIKMMDGGKITGGWNGKVDEGFLKCQSGKKPGRFEGDRISMVEDKLGISRAEAFVWYEENFPNEIKKRKHKKKNTVKDEWKQLKELSPQQINFLHSRKIKHELIKDHVKDFAGTVGLAIFSENGTMSSYQGRNTNPNASKKNRYRIRTGGGAKGLFADFKNIDPSKEVLLVEGMTDWLTLRQHTTQVIALVSKDNGIEQIKALKNKYKIVFIPDNDDAGKETIEKFKECNFGLLSLAQYEGDDMEIKDVNDLWIYCLENGIDGEMFISMLLSDAKRPLSNIEQALKKAVRNRSNVGWLIGEKTFDWATGGITPGTTMLINGASGQGKTTLAMWILMSMLKQGKIVAFYSLETDAGKMLAQVLGYHFGKNWKKEIYPHIEDYLKEFGISNLDNLLLFDDLRTLQDIESSIIDNNVNIAFIDYAQIMDGLKGSSMKEKMGEYAKLVQQIARNTYTAMISLSQIPKSEEHEKPVLYRSPMEAMALKSTADTMINVGIYTGTHKIGFVKCKEGDDDAWGTEFDTGRNKDTGKITIWRDERTANF